MFRVAELAEIVNFLKSKNPPTEFTRQEISIIMNQNKLMGISTIQINSSTREGMQIFIEKDEEEDKITLIAHTKNGVPIHINLRELLQECVACGLLTMALNTGSISDAIGDNLELL